MRSVSQRSAADAHPTGGLAPPSPPPQDERLDWPYDSDAPFAPVCEPPVLAAAHEWASCKHELDSAGTIGVVEGGGDPRKLEQLGETGGDRILAQISEAIYDRRVFELIGEDEDDDVTITPQGANAQRRRRLVEWRCAVVASRMHRRCQTLAQVRSPWPGLRPLERCDTAPPLVPLRYVCL
eukprot:1000581-Prymnesium_polylepis.2